MDYKQLHQEIYESLCEELGTEPHWEVLDYRFRDRIASMYDYLKDQANCHIEKK